MIVYSVYERWFWSDVKKIECNRKINHRLIYTLIQLTIRKKRNLPISKSGTEFQYILFPFWRFTRFDKPEKWQQLLMIYFQRQYLLLKTLFLKSNARLKKIKQNLSNTLRLNFRYLKIIGFPNLRYHPKIIGYIFKNVQKTSKLVLMAFKMKIR